MQANLGGIRLNRTMAEALGISEFQGRACRQSGQERQNCPELKRQSFFGTYDFMTLPGIEGRLPRPVSHGNAPAPGCESVFPSQSKEHTVFPKCIHGRLPAVDFRPGSVDTSANPNQ
jgi:hypothetical protein